MSDAKYDVTAIGNALVDVLVHTDDTFLDANGLVKGAMTLTDAARADELYGLMPPAVERSGGSAGNTVHGIAQLGGRAAYIGRVAADEFGSIYRHDIRAAGVAFDTPVAPGAITGRSLIFVTPDAQRTMQTFLGAASDLGPADVDASLIASSEIVYLEGYLFDPPPAKDAFLKAARAAHDAGRRVALTLSDPFCVARHRGEFVALVDGHIDILFANEDELISLYQAPSFDDALQQVRGRCDIAALTRSEKGSVVVAGDDVHVVDAEPVARVVDTTGAGDLYAAGFLFGLTHGYSIVECARIAGICAAEVISHVGARPEAPLAQLVRDKLAR